MFFPPADFRSLPTLGAWLALSAATPAACAGMLYGAAAGWTVLALAMPALYALGAAAAWLSVYGSRHGVAGTLAGWVLAVLPWALLLPAAIAGKGLVAGWGAGVVALQALAQGLVLALAVGWHAARAPLPAEGQARLDWPGGLRVHLARGRVEKTAAGAGAARAPLLLTLASVPAYHALEPWLQTGEGMVWLAALMHVGVAALSCTVLARAVGQGLRLAQIERRMGGVLVWERLDELERVRQRSRVGRWLRERFPLTGLAAVRPTPAAAGRPWRAGRARRRG